MVDCSAPLILSSITGGYRIVEAPKGTVLCVATSGGHFGNITVSGNLDVSGDTVLSGSLGVSGDTTLSAQLGVSCDAMVSGNLAVSTNLSVSGETRVSGTIYTDRLDVSCDAMVSGNMAVSTNLSVSGDSNVSGNSFITGNTHTVGTAAIGATGPVLNTILDVNSTSKAFVPPRMTTAQRNAIGGGLTDPATGSVIYNTTTNLLNHYNGSAWLAVGAVATGLSGTKAFYDALGGTQTVVILNGLITSWVAS